LASSAYKKGDLELAEKNFRDLSENKSFDSKFRANSYYNLGNTFFKQFKLEDAERAYLDTLKLNPEDVQAKKNLEKVREELKKQKKKQQEREQNQKDKKKDKPKDKGGNQKEQNNSKDKSKPESSPKDKKNEL